MLDVLFSINIHILFPEYQKCAFNRREKRLTGRSDQTDMPRSVINCLHVRRPTHIAFVQITIFALVFCRRLSITIDANPHNTSSHPRVSPSPRLPTAGPESHTSNSTQSLRRPPRCRPREPRKLHPRKSMNHNSRRGLLFFIACADIPLGLHWYCPLFLRLCASPVWIGGALVWTAG